MENIDLAREMRARLYRECRERGQFSSRDKGGVGLLCGERQDQRVVS